MHAEHNEDDKKPSPPTAKALFYPPVPGTLHITDSLWGRKILVLLLLEDNPSDTHTPLSYIEHLLVDLHTEEDQDHNKRFSRGSYPQPMFSISTVCQVIKGLWYEASFPSACPMPTHLWLCKAMYCVPFPCSDNSLICFKDLLLHSIHLLQTRCLKPNH